MATPLDPPPFALCYFLLAALPYLNLNLNLNLIFNLILNFDLNCCCSYCSSSCSSFFDCSTLVVGLAVTWIEAEPASGPVLLDESSNRYLPRPDPAQRCLSEDPSLARGRTRVTDLDFFLRVSPKVQVVQRCGWAESIHRVSSALLLPFVLSPFPSHILPRLIS